MGKFQFSVVVTVYNVAEYVESCVGSVLGQAPAEFEILLVNDASSDSSDSICRELQRGHAEVRVLSLATNGGLSRARNAGLEAARNEYVLFLDGDDSLVPGCLQEVSRILREKGPLDVLQMQYIRYYPQGTTVVREQPAAYETMPMTGEEFFLLGQARGGFNPMVPAYVFRRQFLVERDLRFLPGAIHEDMEFTPRALLEAGRAASCLMPLFNYRQREGSLSNKRTIAHFSSALRVGASLWSGSKTLRVSEQARHVLKGYARYVIESKAKDQRNVTVTAWRRELNRTLEDRQVKDAVADLYRTMPVSGFALRKSAPLFVCVVTLRGYVRRLLKFLARQG